MTWYLNSCSNFRTDRCNSCLLSSFVLVSPHWRYCSESRACREISRCKWVVTDPPQCRTNLRDHFPAGPYFTSERCDEERVSWWIGGPHTLHTMHAHPPAAISDPSLDSLSCGASICRDAFSDLDDPPIWRSVNSSIRGFRVSTCQFK